MNTLVSKHNLKRQFYLLDTEYTLCLGSALWNNLFTMSDSSDVTEVDESWKVNLEIALLGNPKCLFVNAFSTIFETGS